MAGYVRNKQLLWVPALRGLFEDPPVLMNTAPAGSLAKGGLLTLGMLQPPWGQEAEEMVSPRLCPSRLGWACACPDVRDPDCSQDGCSFRTQEAQV